MDMGFTREHAQDALLNTNGLEQATEYILTHPPPAAQAARVSRVQNDMVRSRRAFSTFNHQTGQNVLKFKVL